jgi:hypothetical protein
MKLKTSAPVLASLALVAILSACERKPAAPARPSPAAVAPAARPAPVRPLTFEADSPAAKVGLRLPAEITTYPALHAALYDREVAGLKTFAAKAEDDHKAWDGSYPWRPYARQGQWFLGAAGGRLVALRALWFEDTGGAHPNHGSASLLWDAAANSELQPKALFRPDVDMAPLDAAICDAVKAAKRHRPEAAPLGAMFACPRWTETVLVLAASTAPGKIGGLTAIIDPYVVGPYAEGDYEVTVPQNAIQGLLAPAYAGAFAGAPRSPGNPDGTLSVQMDAVK